MTTNSGGKPDLTVESKGIALNTMVRSPDSYIHSDSGQLNLSPEVMSMLSEYQLENEFSRQKYEYTPEPYENQITPLHNKNNSSSRNATPSYQDILQHHIDSASTSQTPSQASTRIISTPRGIDLRSDKITLNTPKKESNITLSLEEEEKQRLQSLYNDAETTVYAKQSHFPKRRNSNSSFFHKGSPPKPKDQMEVLIAKFSSKETSNQKKTIRPQSYRRYMAKTQTPSKVVAGGLFVRKVAPNKIDDYSPYGEKRVNKRKKKPRAKSKRRHFQKSTLPPLKQDNEITVESVISAPTIATPRTHRFQPTVRSPHLSPMSSRKDDYPKSPRLRQRLQRKTPRKITYGSPLIKSPITPMRVGRESPQLESRTQVIIKTPSLAKNRNDYGSASKSRVLSGKKRQRPGSSSSTSSSVTRGRLTDDLLSLDFKHDDAYTPLPLYIREMGNIEYQTISKYMDELDREPQYRLIAYRHFLEEMDQSNAFCESMRESGAFVVLMKRFNEYQPASKGNDLVPHFTELLPLLQILSILCNRNVRNAELFVRLGGVNKLIHVFRHSVDVLLKSKSTLGILQNLFNDRPILQHEFRALSGINLFFWLAQQRASAHDISKLSQYLSVMMANNQTSLELFQSLGGVRKFKSFIPLRDIIRNRERGGYRR